MRLLYLLFVALYVLGLNTVEAETYLNSDGKIAKSVQSYFNNNKPLLFNLIEKASPATKMLGAWAGNLGPHEISIALIQSRSGYSGNATDISFIGYSSGYLMLFLKVDDTFCSHPAKLSFVDLSKQVSRKRLAKFLDAKVINESDWDNYSLHWEPYQARFSPKCKDYLNNNTLSLSVDTNNNLHVHVLGVKMQGFIPETSIETAMFKRASVNKSFISAISTELNSMFATENEENTYQLREFEKRLLTSSSRDLKTLPVEFKYNCESYRYLASAYGTSRSIKSLVFVPEEDTKFSVYQLNKDESLIKAMLKDSSIDWSNQSTHFYEVESGMFHSKKYLDCDKAIAILNFFAFSRSLDFKPADSKLSDFEMKKYLVSAGGIEMYESGRLKKVIGTVDNSVFLDEQYTANLVSSLPLKIERFYLNNKQEHLFYSNTFRLNTSLVFVYDENLSSKYGNDVSRGRLVGKSSDVCLKKHSSSDKEGMCEGTITTSRERVYFTTSSLETAYQLLTALVPAEKIRGNFASKPVDEDFAIELVEALRVSHDDSIEQNQALLFMDAIIRSDTKLHTLAKRVVTEDWEQKYGPMLKIMRSLSSEMQKEVDLLPGIIDYYLSRYSSVYGSCLSNAVSYTFSDYIEKVDYENGFGQVVGSFGGYSISETYLFNSKFTEICSEVCGVFSMQKALALVFNSSIAEIYNKVETFMRLNKCDSQAAKLFEDGMINLYESKKPDKSISDLNPEQYIAFSY